MGTRRPRGGQTGPEGPKWAKVVQNAPKGPRGVQRCPQGTRARGVSKWLNALEWFLFLIDFSFVLNAIGGFLTTCTGCLVAKGDSVVVVCCVGGSVLC